MPDGHIRKVGHRRTVRSVPTPSAVPPPPTTSAPVTAVPQRDIRLAVASLVLAILGWVAPVLVEIVEYVGDIGVPAAIFLAVVLVPVSLALAFGHVALRRGDGRGLAVAGLAVAYPAAAVIVAGLIAGIVSIASGQ